MIYPNIVLPEGYSLRLGFGGDRFLLLHFMEQTYREMFPQQEDFSHLENTVTSYFSDQTPLWWVENYQPGEGKTHVACLWLGNAIDQVKGNRYSYIFLLSVLPEHRRRGIGTALLRHGETWAKNRGDRQIGLMVFNQNQPALKLYHQLGYQPQSLLMIKSLPA